MAEKKTYTEEQKAEILKYAEDTSVAAAARQYGVSNMTITRWKTAAKVTGDVEKVKTKAKTTGKKVAKKTEEVAAEVKAEAAEVKDEVAAEKIEVKKTARAAARKTKEKAAVKKEAKKEVKKVKAAEKAEVKEAVAAVVKDDVDAAKIETKKKTAAAKRKVKEAVAPAAKAVKKPIEKAKARKVNLVFESLLGGAVTPEEIIEMLPKEASDAYVKIEENTIYWVGKNGEMGSIDIW